MNGDQDMDVSIADKVAEDLVRKSGTSFYWAMRVLPRKKRRAMYAIYAFCRIVDDIADGPGAQADKLDGLARWRREVDNLYQKKPVEAVSWALLEPVQHYGLEKIDFISVIEGMERDSAPRVRIATIEELIRYCDAVACSVGRLANRVFGVDKESGNAIANSLGQALQITNILRDVSEDAAIDRLYFPRDLLLRHGIDSEDPATVVRHPGFPGACDELLKMAIGHYEMAEKLLEPHGRSAMRPAVLMMHTYRRILRLLQARGWDQIDQRVRLSAMQKFLIMIRYGLLPL